MVRTKNSKNVGKAPSPTPIDPDKETQLLVKDRFKRARDFREQDQEEIWKRSYNNWRGILDKSIYPWRSSLFIPWSFTVVETIIPKIFARDPKWRAISRAPESQLNAAQPEAPIIQNNLLISTPSQAAVVNKYLAYSWDRMHMRLKMYDYIKDSLMYSKGYAKVSWNFKTKTKTEMVPVVGEDDVVTFEKQVKSFVAEDDPCVDIVDPFDIYVDPDATSLDNALYLIHRKYVPLDKLKDNPNYKNIEKIKFTNAKTTGVGAIDDSLQQETRFLHTTPSPDAKKRMVEVWEYWESDRLVVIANQTTVLRDSPNPYAHKEIPFVELDDYRDPHKYYGQSELSVIDPLQREINAIRNQRRDYDNLQLNPVIRMVPGTLRNPNSAVMAPGNVWMVSDLNSMDTFTLPHLQGTARDIEAQTAQDIKMSVAIDEIGIGLLPEGSARRSATEVVTASTMAGKRFAIKIALLEESVKRIGKLVFAMAQQFLDDERVIQIVGERGAEEWVRLSPADIAGDFFIDIETGSMLPKDEIAARQEAIQLLQYITPIITPILGQNPAVMMPIMRMILDTYDLPGKQEILEELESSLKQAAESLQQQQQVAQIAQTAQAAAPLIQQEQAEVTAPETAQGTRADLQNEQLLSGE